MRNYAKKNTYYKRLRNYRRPYLGLYTFCTILNSITLFLIFSSVGILLKEILNISVQKVDVDTLIKLLFYILGIILFSFGSSFSLVGFTFIEQKIQRKIRQDMIYAYLNSTENATSFISQTEVHNRIVMDIPKCIRLVGYYMEGWVYAPILSGVFSLLILFIIDKYIALLTLFCSVLNLYSSKLFVHRQRDLKENLVKEKSSYFTLTQECLDGSTEIKIFSLQEKFEKKALFFLINIKEKVSLNNLYEALRDTLTVFSADCITFISLLLLGYFGAQKGIMDFSNVMLALPLSDQISQMLAAFGRYKTIIKNNEPYLKRVFEVIDMKPEERCKITSSTNNLVEKKAELSIKNLSFSYGREMVLNHINLQIPYGRAVAIIGESGSGKSTILKLLLRLYTSSDGEILYNGENSQEMSLNEWRDLFAYMPQNNCFFHKSVAENICVSDKIDWKKLKIISESVGIDEFINERKNGYQSILENKNESFSGGQLQRIALARALYKNAPFLLLDEPTSALDLDSANQIKIILESLIGKQTMIVVTHRLELTENFDKIIVLDHGIIAESGTHKELLERKNLYYHMWITQQMRDV